MKISYMYIELYRTVKLYGKLEFGRFKTTKISYMYIELYSTVKLYGKIKFC